MGTYFGPLLPPVLPPLPLPFPLFIGGVGIGGPGIGGLGIGGIGGSCSRLVSQCAHPHVRKMAYLATNSTDEQSIENFTGLV